MEDAEVSVVTGAFGYTGKYIARRLLALGRTVRTLTGHPDRPNPFGGQVAAYPFNFDKPAELAKSLEGAATLYNTYWIRFPYGGHTYERAIENTRILLRAAVEAGVRRLVHVSIANPSEDSPFPYFRGKAILEREIASSGLSYAIIRPTVIFGKEDILVNNIAYLLRHYPVFIIPGDGGYRLQPISVEDVADLAVGLGQREDNATIDAAGPDIFTFNALVRLVAETVRSSARIVHLCPAVTFCLTNVLNPLVDDIVLTKDEMDGLMANLLVSNGPPTGRTRLEDWLAQSADTVGMRYASELDRHYR